MTNIPTIETARLLLRPHTVDDFSDYATMWSDEAVVRFIGGVPSTREQTWARMLRVAGMWHHMGFGFLAIEEKQSGRFIGEAGFLDMKRDMHPVSTEGTLETGWGLMPFAQGHGYASEALTALIAWAQERFPAKPMTCIIDPENGASLRLARKLGFHEVQRCNYNGDVILLSRPETLPA
ncbi:GNAT family N-acetyltransferase [Rhizobium mesoamericanum]|uniref:GCN5-related N-acetyltransferase n=1 Tax=Rhizobium mesoamericanum STM3625 TaxID=1211777 RepID=K0PUL0_9HYPH|nr:GNAT family N-acetyltransferase [Rhizobium mesoamericanum]CCM75070.1 GCN5-related N-acetyltransferase [Rhizobium mesoamericanum STM3625]